MNRLVASPPLAVTHRACYCALVIGIALCLRVEAQAQVRIKALTTVEGVRINQLTGMGLVTGLDGTGGKSPITRQFAQNLVMNFGVRANPLQRLVAPKDTTQRTDNLSVVTVTAELPIFSRAGSQIDVTVSTFDEAESLQGGILLTTPLFGVDDQVYAVAAGPVSVGGFSFSGDAGSVQKNHPTSGRIANGATVETEVPSDFVRNGSVRLLLRYSDFETAQRVVHAINFYFPGVAQAIDARTLNLIVPIEYALDPVAFVSAVRSIPVDPDMAAKVVINERTGTVVVGHHVRISPVAIAHGNLSVVTAELPQVVQPAPLSEGRTAIVPRTELRVEEERRPMFVMGPTTTVGELAGALNMLGVTPRDLSAIFQQLQAAHALHAELEFQ